MGTLHKKSLVKPIYQLMLPVQHHERNRTIIKDLEVECCLDSNASMSIDNVFVFQVYAAGCDIVILASDFQRVQIIPGVTHGNVKVSCIDASTDSGKVNNVQYTVKDQSHFHQLGSGIFCREQFIFNTGEIVFLLLIN